MKKRRRFNLKKSDRRATAVVELALLLPFLCTLTLGVLEVGRAAIVSTTMFNAAQNGAQVAAMASSSNATVTSTINSILTANNINSANATISILVNGTAADVSTSNPNDEITVTVSIAASQVNLTSFGMSLLKNATFSGTLTVMRQ
jgi:Flp pilus assembly protein TadG